MFTICMINFIIFSIIYAEGLTFDSFVQIFLNICQYFSLNKALCRYFMVRNDSQKVNRRVFKMIFGIVDYVIKQKSIQKKFSNDANIRILLSYIDIYRDYEKTK